MTELDVDSQPRPAGPRTPLPALPDLTGIQAAFDAVVEAVLVVDSDGVVILANRAAGRLFGYRHAALLGRTVETLIPAAVRAGHPDHRRHSAVHPARRPTGVGPPLSALHQDGTPFPVEISLAPMTTATGTYTTAVIRDLTGQQAGEQAGEQAGDRLGPDRRLRMAFDRAPIGLALVDARPGHAPTVLVANAALGELAGIAPADLHSRSAVDLVPTPGAPGDPDRPDTVTAVESLWVRPDGDRRWVSTSSTLVRDAAGSPDYLVINVVDITDRKRAEVDNAARAERDRRIAATLQAGLMPYVPRRVGPVRAASRYRPAGSGVTVGGDWSDVLALPDGRIAMVVGDVAGQGIESAATMTRLRTVVRMLATSGVSPAGVMRRLNDVMHETDMEADIDLATLVYAQLDPSTGALRYCSAGHLPLLMLAGDLDQPHRDVSPVPAVGGPPIGVIAGLRYTEHEIYLEPGSTLIGFTDGLIERRGGDLDESLLRLLAGIASLPTSATLDVEALADAVIDLSPNAAEEDDIAVIVLAFEPNAPLPWPRTVADVTAERATAPRRAVRPTDRADRADRADLADLARPPDRWA